MFHSRVDYFIIAAVTNSICATLHNGRVLTIDSGNFHFQYEELIGLELSTSIIWETLQTNRNYVFLSHYLR